MRIVLGILIVLFSTLSFAEETNDSWSLLANQSVEGGHYMILGIVDDDRAALLKLEINYSTMVGYWLIQFSEINPDPVVNMIDIQFEYADGTTLSLKPQMNSYVNETMENVSSNGTENQKSFWYAIDIEQVSEMGKADYVIFVFQKESDIENEVHSTHKFTLAGSSAAIGNVINDVKAANIDIDTRPTIDVTAETVAANKAAAERQRLAEEQRQQAIAAEAERLRLEEEAAAEAERQRIAAVEAEKEKYREAFNDFDWSSGCGSAPSLPSNSASNYTIDKFNDRYHDWVECQNDMIDEDAGEIRDLVLEIGGTWEWTSSDESSWEWTTPGACECGDRIKKLHEFKDERAERRANHIDRINDAIEDSNDVADREEFWNDINDSIDNSFRDLERQQQESWDRMYNQPYMVPGLN